MNVESDRADRCFVLSQLGQHPQQPQGEQGDLPPGKPLFLLQDPLTSMLALSCAAMIALGLIVFLFLMAWNRPARATSAGPCAATTGVRRPFDLSHRPFS